MRHLILYMIGLLIPLHAGADNGTVRGKCPLVKIQAERLPDLNVPRSGHGVFCSPEGEVTVFGGHTTGFIPTPTAEYYADGAWHLMQMTYSHDYGLTEPLDSSRVLLAGGCEKNLGVGQTLEAELYDYRNHTFTGFGCLERKRVMPTGARMPDGSVVIAGNWFSATDHGSIERFDGEGRFSLVKQAVQRRSRPYILPISNDDALIFGNNDDAGHQLDSIWVDRLQGAAFRVPLLEQYRLTNLEIEPMSSDFAIGDEQKGVYSYLLAGTDNRGEMALILLSDTVFQLLPTSSRIPVAGVNGERIFYVSTVMADRERHRAFVCGVGIDTLAVGSIAQSQMAARRHYLLAIDYACHPAELVLYYTDPLAGGHRHVLLPDGDIMIAGGTLENNFTPSAAVWLLSPGRAVSESRGLSAWWLWLLMLVVLAVLALVYWFYLRKKHGQYESQSVMEEPKSVEVDPTELLMQRISLLMSEELLYLKPDLKLQDLALALNVNTRYISDSIKSQRGMSFVNFVNSYRINHAKRLMRSNPDIKINTVWEASGFANETSFFRTFKAVTSQTPKEWLQQEG